MEDDFTSFGSQSIIPDNLDERWAKYEQALDTWRQESSLHHANSAPLRDELQQAISNQGEIGNRMEADPDNQALKEEYKTARERVRSVLAQLKGPEKPRFEDF